MGGRGSYGIFGFWVMKHKRSRQSKKHRPSFKMNSILYAFLELGRFSLDRVLGVESHASFFFFFSRKL